MLKVFIHLDDEVMDLSHVEFLRLMESLYAAVKHFHEICQSTEPSYVYEAINHNRVITMVGVIRTDDMDKLREAVQEILRTCKPAKSVSIRAQNIGDCWIVTPTANKPWLEYSL